MGTLRSKLYGKINELTLDQTLVFPLKPDVDKLPSSFYDDFLKLCKKYKVRRVYGHNFDDPGYNSDSSVGFYFGVGDDAIPVSVAEVENIFLFKITPNRVDEDYD